MYTLVGRNPESSYRKLLVLGELLGFLSVVSVGLLFDKRVSTNTYDWQTNPFSYHPLMMTLGLLFCYGNAMLLYRTFRTTPKLIVKILHAIFLLVSLAGGLIGLTAIIRSKQLGKRSHFMSYHSWIGLITLSLFVLQWICGFICFLVPQLSLNVRKAYMPSHRLWGKVIFLSAVVAILTGLSEHGVTSSFFAANDSQRVRRLMMNFYGIFASLFALIVIYLLSNDEYQRPPEKDAQT
ncbi:unnamed protein product [Adineta ricciae]|uniref:Cytochrome b561 domain-containing protein n=1 Tax=Adineta ricciae TaxID=249248 RepID=A0A814Y4W3_ADIRI|nr:unnamed protein product [Adineta ricciae]CAF1495374.1 unnamed protein product [Adineta ricciae]